MTAKTRATEAAVIRPLSKKSFSSPFSADQERSGGADSAAAGIDFDLNCRSNEIAQNCHRTPALLIPWCEIGFNRSLPVSRFAGIHLMHVKTLAAILILISINFAQADEARTFAGLIPNVTTTQVTILGEDHGNDGLSRSIRKILASRVRNSSTCLFVELSEDMQLEIDESFKGNRFDDFLVTVVNSKKNAVLNAYRRFGVQPEEIAVVSAILREAESKVDPTLPIDPTTFNFLINNHIQIIAYDSASNSPELSESMYYQLKIEKFKMESQGDRERQIEGLAARNKIMSQNIAKNISARKCVDSFVVVGYGHLLNEKFLKSYIKELHTYRNLQSFLSEFQIESFVYILEKQDGLSKKEYFDNFTKSIANP